MISLTILVSFFLQSTHLIAWSVIVAITLLFPFKIIFTINKVPANVEAQKQYEHAQNTDVNALPEEYWH